MTRQEERAEYVKRVKEAVRTAEQYKVECLALERADAVFRHAFGVRSSTRWKLKHPWSKP